MGNIYEDRLTADERKEHSDLGKKIVKRSDGICYGFVWFESDEDARRYGELNKKLGLTVNGGWYHGHPLIREVSRDHVDEESGKKLYACLD